MRALLAGATHMTGTNRKKNKQPGGLITVFSFFLLPPPSRPLASRHPPSAPCPPSARVIAGGKRERRGKRDASLLAYIFYYSRTALPRCLSFCPLLASPPLQTGWATDG